MMLNLADSKEIMNEQSAATQARDAEQDLMDEPSEEGDSRPLSSKEISNITRSNSGFWQRLKRAIFGRNDAETLREDISEALKNSGDLDSAFSADERAMLDNILLMREVRVQKVMVPRAEIEAVDRSITLGELLTVFESSGHSRMPVFNENLDDPKGMIHIRDLLAYLTRQARNGRRSAKSSTPKTPQKTLQKTLVKPLDLTRIKLDKTLHEAGIIRSVLFIPESMLAADLLKRMQATRTQMALVIDEYGGTDGLVSLEDIVEIVVGDIEDEHDDIDGPAITAMSDGVWEADAKTSIEELTPIIETDLSRSENAEYADTLGGLIFASLGRVPVRGEVVRMVPKFEFHIKDADARRIKRVQIVRLKTRRAYKAVAETNSEANDDTNSASTEQLET